MSALLRVRVTPRSARCRIDEWDGQTLHLRVTAAPTDGKANAAVIELLAQALGVPKSTVTLKTGMASRQKQIVLDSISETELSARLGKLCSPQGASS